MGLLPFHTSLTPLDPLAVQVAEVKEHRLQLAKNVARRSPKRLGPASALFLIVDGSLIPRVGVSDSGRSRRSLRSTNSAAVRTMADLPRRPSISSDCPTAAVDDILYLHRKSCYLITSSALTSSVTVFARLLPIGHVL